MNEGEALKRAIEKDRRTIEEISAAVNIHRGTIYNLYKKDKLTEAYKRRFTEIGILIGEPGKEAKVISIAPKRQGLKASFSLTEAPFPTKEEMTTRTLKAIEALGISTYQIEKETEIPHQTFVNAKNGSQGISQNVIKKLCDRYAISINYIMNGTEPILIGDAEQRSRNKLIPLYDMDKMNRDLHQFKEGDPNYVIDQIDLPMLRNTTAAWDVLSDEMYPEYKKGAKVLVRHMPKEDVDFGAIYFIMTINSLIMRKVRKGSAPDKWRLVASNKEYDEREIDISKVKDIFLVRGCINIDSY